MPHIRLASIAWSDGVGPACERDRSILPKIDDHFDFGIEAMDVTGLVVHGVSGKPHAIEPDRTHLIPF